MYKYLANQLHFFIGEWEELHSILSCNAEQFFPWSGLKYVLLADHIGNEMSV